MRVNLYSVSLRSNSHRSLFVDRKVGTQDVQDVLKFEKKTSSPSTISVPPKAQLFHSPPPRCLFPCWDFDYANPMSSFLFLLNPSPVYVPEGLTCNGKFGVIWQEFFGLLVY